MAETELSSTYTYTYMYVYSYLSIVNDGRILQMIPVFHDSCVHFYRKKTVSMLLVVFRLSAQLHV